MAENLTIRIDGDTKAFLNELNKVEGKTKGMSESLKSLAKGTAIAFTALGGAAIYAVNEAKKMESIQTQFEVLTGSAQKASLLMKDLGDFAASTPFQFEGIAKTGQQLLSFGFQADEVKTKLQQIGDVAAASNQPIQDVGLIFGQVAAAGKLTGERLLQLQERAIPIGPALAKTMGVAESSIKNLVSKGAVDFATFEKAFASLSAEGGKAFGGMAKQSQTLAGLISTVKDNISLFAADLGKEMVPYLKIAAQQFISFIQGVREGGSALSTMRDVLQGVLKMGTIVKTTIQNLGLVIGGGLATAIEAASAALSGDFSKAAAITKNNVKDIAKEIENNTMEMHSNLNSLNDSFVAAEKERKAKALEDEKSAATAKQEAMLEAMKAEAEAKAALQEEQRLAEQERLMEHEARMKEIEMGRITSISEAKRQVAEEDLAAQVKENNLRMKEEQRYGKTVAKSQAFFRSKEAEGVEQGLDNLISLGRTGNKDLVAIAQTAAIAKATMNTAEGVTKALTYGPILGPILATTQLAAGLAQIAVIKSQKFAKGGEYTGGIPGVDSIPATLQRGELVVPTKSYDQVVESAANQKLAEQGEQSTNQNGSVEVMIGFDGSEAENVITTRQNKARSLGTSTEIA